MGLWVEIVDLQPTSMEKKYYDQVRRTLQGDIGRVLHDYWIKYDWRLLREWRK